MYSVYMIDKNNNIIKQVLWNKLVDAKYQFEYYKKHFDNTVIVYNCIQKCIKYFQYKE